MFTVKHTFWEKQTWKKVALWAYENFKNCSSSKEKCYVHIFQYVLDASNLGILHFKQNSSFETVLKPNLKQKKKSVCW